MKNETQGTTKKCNKLNNSKCVTLGNKKSCVTLSKIVCKSRYDALSFHTLIFFFLH